MTFREQSADRERGVGARRQREAQVNFPEALVQLVAVGRAQHQAPRIHDDGTFLVAEENLLRSRNAQAVQRQPLSAQNIFKSPAFRNSILEAKDSKAIYDIIAAEDSRS